MQSRYYDPAVGRFINADTYSSTGQGIIGNNMFAYCNNSPAYYSDPSGDWPSIHNQHREMMLYQSGSDVPLSPVVTITPDQESPGLPVEYSYVGYDNHDNYPGKAYHEQAFVFEFSALDASLNSLTLASASFELIKGGWESEHWVFSPFNAGKLEANAGASIGADGITGGIGLMAAFWAPSITYSRGGSTVTFSLQLGSIGAKYNRQSRKFEAGAGFGWLGFSIECEW